MEVYGDYRIMILFIEIEIYISDYIRAMKNNQSNIKIKAYAKIQEVQGGYMQKIVNKEVGNIVHIQTDKPHNLKNCITSQKTNAQLYKQFYKQFITNIHTGQNQMILSCSLEEKARIETSIGSQNNPGLFFIGGIGLLDEKYQEDFKRVDVQVAFMEYRDGKVYDLISYTKQPLKMIKINTQITFGQTYCKIATFTQFLKLLKIALFNNKERDIRMNSDISQQPPENRIKTSLIMTITTKKWSTAFKQHKAIYQKNVVIDFAQCHINGVGGVGVVGQEQHNNNQKNLWDYILIELNNLSSKKKQYYHLIQPNPLLSLITTNLLNGNTYIVMSMSTISSHFQSNYKFINDVYECIDMISGGSGLEVGQPLGLKDKGKEDGWVDGGITEKQMMDGIEAGIERVAHRIKTRRYASMRQFREGKQKTSKVMDYLVEWIDIYRRIFIRQFENKRKLRLAQNQMIADQMRLIGICIKTDNYKDFYSAKSYLSLQREMGIKTAESGEMVSKMRKIGEEVREKFVEMKEKHSGIIGGIEFGWEREVEVKGIAGQILEFIRQVFFNTLFFNQRTLSDEALREEYLLQNLSSICNKLRSVNQQISEMEKKRQIMFEMKEVKKDAHFILLMRSIQNLVGGDEHRKKQQISKQKNLKRKQSINDLSYVKQTISQNSSEMNKIVKNKIKFKKLQNLGQQKIDYQIKGQVKLSNLLVNPNKILLH